MEGIIEKQTSHRTAEHIADTRRAKDNEADVEDMLEPGIKVGERDLPANYNVFDKHDQRVARKQHEVIKPMVKEIGIQRTLPVTQEEIDLEEKKLDQAELMQRDMWIYDNYVLPNRSNPAQMRVIQQMFPDYFARRSEQIQLNAALQKQLEMWQLYGVGTSNNPDKLREEGDLLWTLSKRGKAMAMENTLLQKGTDGMFTYEPGYIRRQIVGNAPKENVVNYNAIPTNPLGVFSLGL